MAKSRESRSVTRQELYELVWTTPMRHLAVQFGISDVGLKKHCTRHKIPAPPVGYWAKKANGKTVRRVPLPACDNPALAIVTIGGRGPSGTLSDTRVPPPVASTFYDPELKQLAEAELRGEDAIVVADSLRSPHPLVARTQQGLIAASRARRYHHDPVLCPYREDELCCLFVRVGQKNIGRAMRIMDALIKGLEKRGYKVSVPGKGWLLGTMVEAFGCHFEIRLRELLVRREHKPTAKEREWLRKYPGSSSVPKWDYALSNQLRLELRYDFGHRGCTIQDGKKRRIENRLSQILLTILRHADDNKRRVVILSEEARKRVEVEQQLREEEENRRREEQRREEEQTRVTALFAAAAQWERCSCVRKYVEAIRRLAGEHYGLVRPDSQLDHWLRWAEDVADRCDPLVVVRRDMDSFLAGFQEAGRDAGPATEHQ